MERYSPPSGDWKLRPSLPRPLVCFEAASAGRAGLFFELSLSFWDYAAGSLIVAEAGGVCSTITGGPLPLDGSKSTLAAGGKQAYSDFMALIKEK